MIPNYNKNNTLNLMSSIVNGLGGKNSHPELGNLKEEIKAATNVVLLVLDGLGRDSLERLDKKSFLRKNYSQELNSVFPSTTAAAITTFYTGLSPQEHGFVGWYMYLKDLDQVVKILPFQTRRGQEIKVGKKKINFPKTLFSSLSVDSYLILKKAYFSSKYNTFMKGKAKPLGINNLRGLGSKIAGIVKLNKKRKYIYAYWGEFDNFCHAYGKNDNRSKKHLQDIDLVLGRLAKKLVGTDTLILITADHGQIITTRKKTILINHHPRLEDCLYQPLCGEPRAAFCHVFPQKKQQFVSYVKKYFREYCTLHTSEELIEKGYFGIGKINPKLKSRLGDFVLLLKENYVFKHYIKGEERGLELGYHGGISEEEMKVPLVKVKL